MNTRTGCTLLLFGIASLCVGCGAAPDAGPEAEQTDEAPASLMGPDRNLYRFYAGTEHFYTSNEFEGRSLGFTPEGVVGMCWSTWQPSTTQMIYRLYSPHRQRHILTIDTTEVNNLKNQGWIEEESPCFSDIWQPSGGCIAHRFWHPGADDHFYTASSTEARNAGYVPEGDIGNLHHCSN